MPAPALELDHVWKRYVRGQRGGVLAALRKPGADAFWSLRDVSLRVQPGESVGLVGHNGAGKTTTLKLLAGISRPTRGRASSMGRVASLINLGAGFHRELTGRENVYLNGVILGLTRQEVRKRFDDIVEFAELGPYIDTPVKQYSSGMYARLGFSVAVHVDPDVLLVDEVLSVGDVQFQDRSIRRMLSFRDRGCSILFVSHNLSAIEMMCQRALWLDHGAVLAEGSSQDVVRQYLDSVDQQLVADTSPLDGDERSLVRVERLEVLGDDGQPCTDFEFGDALTVRLHVLATSDMEEPTCLVTVRGDYSPLFHADSRADGRRLGPWPKGRHTVECRFETLPVLPGLYRVEALASEDGAGSAAQASAAFRVNTDLEQFGSSSVVGRTKSRGGFLAVAYDWKLEVGAESVELPGLSLPRPPLAR